MGFLFRDNFRLEVASAVISSMDVKQVSVDVRGKCGESRLRRSRDIRLPHFVTDERITPAYADHRIRPKRRTGGLLKRGESIVIK